MAAAELVVESGPRSTTLAGVGLRAGYSRGIASHHFGSKQALLEALTRGVQSGFVPGLGGLPPGLDRLVRLVDGYVRALADLDVTGRAYLLLWAESAVVPELARVFQERDASFRADLVADVEAGIAGGVVRPDAHPADVAVAVVSQLRGLGLQVLAAGPEPDMARLAAGIAGGWRRSLART
ncbi:TetR family transcriptional regulator [Umezawaea tangerina]|uniref:TetR family transcriptional regulator n=1 Tax=Umezawaea tangerina TaxID=84725 RepID=A0A2T0SZB1_9PSEU|nr:TetR family transcriptional regulator [Umezawaea tangerina]